MELIPISQGSPVYTSNYISKEISCVDTSQTLLFHSGIPSHPPLFVHWESLAPSKTVPPISSQTLET